ncbi:MAG: hypothetical protein EBW38_03170 [Rhodobacteraceae bacterium]|nr:hypothetical protein [Paracoccaceae bacterium]
MQQAPATPKIKRWRNLGLARLGILKADQNASLQPSERLALMVRGEKRARQSTASQVVFLLPLVRRKQVSDWSLVEDNLLKTLMSFVNQSDPNWIAIICGQDRPSLPNDERIQFLPFDQPITGNDKWAKLAKLVEYFPKLARPSGYVMTFDADDLAHRDLVKQYLSIQHPNGYLIEQGIVHDIAAGLYGQAGRPNLLNPLRKPFWKLCGSCAAFRYDPNEPKLLHRLITEITQHEHRMFPYLAKLAGRSLCSLQNTMIMYEFNHGQNFGLRRNRGSFKSRFIKRYRINNPSRLEHLLKGFS